MLVVGPCRREPVSEERLVQRSVRVDALVVADPPLRCKRNAYSPSRGLANSCCKATGSPDGTRTVTENQKLQLVAPGSHSSVGISADTAALVADINDEVTEIPKPPCIARLLAAGMCDSSERRKRPNRCSSATKALRIARLPPPGHSPRLDTLGYVPVTIRVGYPGTVNSGTGARSTDSGTTGAASTHERNANTAAPSTTAKTPSLAKPEDRALRVSLDHESTTPRKTLRPAARVFGNVP